MVRVAGVLGVGAALAAPGDLDTSFGTGGIVLTDIDSGSDQAYGVAVDSAGRVVVAGYSHNGSNDDFAVVRYTSSGDLDTSFGTGGKVTTDFGTGDDFGSAVVVDSAGRVVVAGAKRLLLPTASVGDIPTIPGELFAKFQTSFYADPKDAVFKALGVK